MGVQKEKIMKKIKEIMHIYRRCGFKNLTRVLIKSALRPLRSLYYDRDWLRGKITKKEVTYNGVQVRPYRRNDRFFPLSPPPNKGGHSQKSDYEKGLCTALRDKVSPGDKVVIIGGGLGVTAVVAAKETGSEGQVLCFEGSQKMVEHIRETITINEMENRIKAINRVVSDKRGVIGTTNEKVPVLEADELPPCDILEMDVEGVEKEILQNLDISPSVIILETHGNIDVIKQKLEAMEYTIESECIAEVGPYRADCERNGIYVLTATSN